MKHLIVIVLLFSLMGIGQGCEGQVRQKTQEDGQKSFSSMQNSQQKILMDVDSGQNISIQQNSGVDFRYAVQKVMAGVVHVNSSWEGINDQEKGIVPFGENLEDEFWYRFFGPFSQRLPLQASASGVIISNDGYIITNNHVIEGASNVEVVLSDQRSYSAEVIGRDPATDLALIKIDEKGLRFIEFGNSDAVEIGQWVLAVGNPFNLSSTVTAGIVSAKARNINILRDREAIESFIQTDAAVNPGNSGGALVDLNGQLVGINTAIATPTGTYAGYSFAIPVNIVIKIADDLLNYGSVQRGYLGIIIRDYTGNLAKQLKMNFTPGVYIDSLYQDGAAFKAGVKAGDIITKIDGVPVESAPQLQEIIAKHRPGETVAVSIIRNNSEQVVQITLQGSSGLATASNGESILVKVLGIDVQEITDQEREKYGLKNGLKVTQIYKGKVREFTNMKPGFVITKVNGNPVRTKKDLTKIIESTSGAIMMEGTYPGTGEVIYYGFGI